MKTTKQTPIIAMSENERSSARKMTYGKRPGATMTVVAFICIQILCWSSGDAQPTTILPATVPCSRLLMKGIDDDDLPWLQLGGIYHLQTNFTVDYFPVYKHESNDMYFYYNRSMKELRFGEPYQNTSVLLAAFTNGHTEWVYVNNYPPSTPFDSMITGWYQYDPVSQQHFAYPRTGSRKKIEPTCIEDSVATCSSGMVEFDDNLKPIDSDTGAVINFNILGLDYYGQIPGFYINSRPVYTRIRSDVVSRTYLFYKEGYWLIAEASLNALAVVKAQSSAMRPEHVIGNWELRTNGRFTSVNVKLRCRALTVDRACDASPTTQCLNGGTCMTSFDGVKKYCTCAPGYRGDYCDEVIPSCSNPKEMLDLITNIEGSRYYFVTSWSEGSVLTIFRNAGLRPSYWFSTCQGSTWSNDSITILQPTTTTKSTTARSTTSTTFMSTTSTTTRPTRTTYRYWNNDYRYTTRRYVFWWDDSTAATAMAVTVMLMQVINPVIIYCIIQCVSCARESRVEQEEDAVLQIQNRNYQTALNIFRQNHPEPEEAYDAVTASQLRSINEEYRKISSEITERKEERKNKSKIKVKFCRLFSLYAYFTFWTFLLYVILVFTTRLFGGSVFIVLGIIAAVFVFVSHLIVVLEYIYSSERQYLKNLSTSVFAVERIEAIRATKPTVFLQAECYHYETRTRTVTYTDASGHLRTRYETYQEKVVTDLILETVSYQYWKDTSPPQLAGVNNKGITKIKMTLSVEPGDEATAAVISELYSAFHDAHENRDTFVDFSIEKVVPGFEKRLAAYTDNREKPAWVSSAFFLVATILCFSWPYRWAFNAITSRTEFNVSKLIYIGHPVDETNPSGAVNSYTATGNGDSGGEHLKTDGTAVAIDGAPPPYMTTEFVNPTFMHPA